MGLKRIGFVLRRLWRTWPERISERAIFTVIFFILIAGLFMGIGWGALQDQIRREADKAVVVPAPTIYPLMNDNAALALALADLRRLPVTEQVFTRYVWDTDANMDTVRGIAYAANLISTHILPASLIGKRDAPPELYPLIATYPDGGRIVLLRVNLRTLALNLDDQDRYVKVWEDFQFEPRFNYLLTKDTIKFAAGVDLKINDNKIKKKSIVKVKTEVKEEVLDAVQVPQYTDEKGILRNEKWVKRVITKIVESDKVVEQEVGGLDISKNVVRLVSDHIDQKLMAELVERTQSQAPIATHNYLVSRWVSTIQKSVKQGR